MQKIKKLSKKDKLKLIGIIIAISLVLFMTSIAMIVLKILSDTPLTNLENLSDSFSQTSSIYDKDGKLLEKIESLEYRIVVDIDKVPKFMKDAFISIEDHRFYKHHGIDYIGIAGAIKDNIKAHALVRGGSTITQQLSRNLFLTNKKTINRKLQEAYISLSLEKQLTKEEILEAYLNRINLGQGAYGVEAAAQTYFSKDIWDLNLAQCALIAGISKSPEIYPPFKRIPIKNYTEGQIIGIREINNEQMYLVLNKKSFERQKIVLNKMKELGKITEKEYNDALNFDTIASLNPGIKKFHNMSSYSTDYIKSEAARMLSNHYNISQEESEHKLFTGGYKIYSSIDENMQKNLEEIYKNYATLLANENSNKGAKGLKFSRDEALNILDNSGNLIYFNKNNFFDNEFNFKIDKGNYNINQKGDLAINKSFFNTNTKKLDIVDLYTIENDMLYTYNMGNINIPENVYEVKNDYIIIDHSYLKDNPEFYSIDENNNLSISKKYYSYDENPTLQPESSSVILDNKGYVKAIVGGLDIQNKNAKIFNRATNSFRSPGDLIKPITVYLTALENGYTLGSVADDVPIKINGVYWPKNPYEGYKGLSTMRMALEYNSNVQPVVFLEQLGLEKALNTLVKLGIVNEKFPEKDSFITPKESEKNDFGYDALALGNMKYGISNVQAASMYSAIASLGDVQETSSVIKIEDTSGNIIVDNTHDKPNQIFDKTNMHLLRDALRTNITRGNAKGLNYNQSDFAGTIGENKFNSDLWATGFNNNYTISTWIGADSPKIELAMDKKMIMNLFKTICKMANKDMPEEKFTSPEPLKEIYICQKNGKIGTKLCEEVGAGYIEKYKIGTEPTEYCKDHVKLLICNTSGKLAGEYCPKEEVEYKVLFKRNGYKLSEHNNILPDDYEYVPTTYCNIHTEEWYKKEQEKKKLEKQKKSNLKTTKDKKDTKETKSKNIKSVKKSNKKSK